MTVKKYCGYCADGHLHWVTCESAALWEKTDKKDPAKTDVYRQRFETCMFERDFFDERSHAKLKDVFIPLLPTNCPLMEFNFLTEYEADKEEDIPDGVAPFQSAGDAVPNASLYVHEFEDTRFGIRFRRETEKRCKQTFYNLIKEKYQLTDDQQLEDIPYAILRQNFLRQFWSYTVQNDLLAMFRDEQLSDQGTPRAFLVNWSWNFTYFTIELSRNIVDGMKMKIPVEYEDQRKFLAEYERGVLSWPDFFGNLIKDEAFAYPRLAVPQTVYDSGSSTPRSVPLVLSTTATVMSSSAFFLLCCGVVFAIAKAAKR